MTTRHLLLHACVALQLLALGALYAYYQSGLLFPVITLEASRVDPRDPLRGDYVILRYAISRVPAQAARDGLRNGRVYATLEADADGRWRVAALGHTRPDREPTAGRPWLRAKHVDGRLEYDIERYFVAEGRGNPSGRLQVEIAIRADGRPQIKRFLVDGEEWR